MNNTYEHDGEWSGYKISKTEKGFIVSGWSRIQGNTTGDKYLYKFDNTLTPEIDLNAKWNDFMNYGEYLAHTIRKQYREAKENGYKTNILCLKKGDTVK